MPAGDRRGAGPERTQDVASLPRPFDSPQPSWCGAFRRTSLSGLSLHPFRATANQVATVALWQLVLSGCSSRS